MIFNKITKWWQSFRFYIIADPADNSVTLSKALFNHMKDNAHEGDEAYIRVQDYGFKQLRVHDKPKHRATYANVQYSVQWEIPLYRF